MGRIYTKGALQSFVQIIGVSVRTALSVEWCSQTPANIDKKGQYAGSDSAPGVFQGFNLLIGESLRPVQASCHAAHYIAPQP